MQISKVNEVYLKVETDSGVERELSDYFTFEVPGHRFMPAYRNKIWDGKIRLFSPATGKIYVGLLPYIKDFCYYRGGFNLPEDAYSKTNNDKFTVVALREIADKKIDLGKTWLSIVKNAQKYQPVQETDIDEDQAVPLNENASEVSFDNFEKENASEKKRKKIYMTQNEIQKLINQKKDDSQTDDIETDLEEDVTESSDTPKDE